VDGLRARLDAMGVSNDVPVFRLSGFDASTERRALALWDAALLDRGYRRMTRALSDARHGAVESLDVASLERAAAHAFVLGGEAIRMIVLDPLLPDGIVDGGARGAFFDAMRRYDEHGRALWRQVMSASEGAATALRQTHDG
jgi:phenylacetic acid degradation operon negative regulatory protein